MSDIYEGGRLCGYSAAPRKVGFSQGQVPRSGPIKQSSSFMIGPDVISELLVGVFNNFPVLAQTLTATHGGDVEPRQVSLTRRHDDLTVSEKS
jgi:hypothetical protein